MMHNKPNTISMTPNKYGASLIMRLEVILISMRNIQSISQMKNKKIFPREYRVQLTYFRRVLY